MKVTACYFCKSTKFGKRPISAVSSFMSAGLWGLLTKYNRFERYCLQCGATIPEESYTTDRQMKIILVVTGAMVVGVVVLMACFALTR